ncbi:HAD-IIA family hydrolase [Arthrobacter sp. I2-34]|uniref:HAD-IIA family hydrolase n=1 Tax=Arthrobacter hankyongi TaxID=2904801 RepID=A0ABS9LBE2_9MICC|nr:HAD-IIA family hydrolase [Arthrobacter hankyongi]MCG2623908.1 HAD-IIA family hydrolase [Arthrobacter hankyongi]
MKSETRIQGHGSLSNPVTKTEPTLIDGYDALLCDLDGVVYVGAGAIEGATEALDRLPAAGIRLGYVTNNASRSSEQVAAHLRELGAPACADQVFGSARAGAALLARHVAPGAKVLVTGSRTLVEEVELLGFVPVDSADQRPDAVIQGFDPGLGWQDLAQASYAIAAGAFWVATNTDMTLPRPEGKAPGNGSLVAAVQAATGATPLVAGKPEAALFTTAAQSLQAENPLVVGDRLDTDILGGNNAGMDTAVVLTGVDTVESILAARTAERPRYLLAKLGDLYKPYPQVTSVGGTYACGRSSATVENGTVLYAGDRSDLDTWRAACAAWWGAHPEAPAAFMPELAEHASIG